MPSGPCLAPWLRKGSSHGSDPSPTYRLPSPFVQLGQCLHRQVGDGRWGCASAFLVRVPSGVRDSWAQLVLWCSDCRAVGLSRREHRCVSQEGRVNRMKDKGASDSQKNRDPGSQAHARLSTWLLNNTLSLISAWEFRATHGSSCDCISYTRGGQDQPDLLS